MITLKYWNSLSNACRKTIVNIISNNSDIDDEIIFPYHHSFDYDSTGKRLKCYLSRIFLTKDNKLKVFTEILPTFTTSDETVKKVQKKQEKNKSFVPGRRLVLPRRYYFRMYTKDDPEDGSSVWEDAYSESEARDMVYSDFHSIIRLDLIKVV